MTSPLSIAYLLEGTELSGGVKVVLNQANLMASRGHRVTVVSKGPAPDWIRLEASFRRVAAFEPSVLPEADVTVATYWTTIGPALRAPSRAAAHYCQGFEAGFAHNVGDHEAIIAAYQTPIPCLAVSEVLARLVHDRFARPSRVVPPALEPFWRPRWRRRPRRRARVVVMHPFEFDLKGVGVGLDAVRTMRDAGVECVLVRISQWPVSEAEQRVLVADEFHQHLPPRGVAHLLRNADLLLAPSWESEGFGLYVLEAMASGLPVVASDIPAFRALAGASALLAPFDRPDRFAAAAREVLADSGRWRALRKAGLEAARWFSRARIARVAEDALSWVATGRWRSEP